MAMCKSVIVLTLAFVAGISAQSENKDAENSFSFGEPIVVNLDSLPSDKFETFAAKHSPASLVIGNVNCDVRVYNASIFRAAAINRILVQDYIINAPVNVRISYIAAIERVNQLGSARILNGGIGYTTTTIRFQSALSRPLDYTLEIWGR